MSESAATHPAASDKIVGRHWQGIGQDPIIPIGISSSLTGPALG